MVARAVLSLRCARWLLPAIFLTLSACAAFSSACAGRRLPQVPVAFAETPCERSIGDGEVRWLGPETPHDRERLTRWCGAVGPAVVRSRPGRETPASIRQLAIVSWNTHVGGGDVAALLGRLRRGEFTDGVAVTRFVLLLQEVYRRGAEVPPDIPSDAAVPHAIVERAPAGDRRDIREIGERERLAFVYAPAVRNGRRPEDRGNAVLSTEALDEATIIVLPLERQRRVAIAATIAGRTANGTAWRLRVVDAHFDTAIAAFGGGPADARRRQAIALLAALETLPPATDVVLGGDLNTWMGDREPAVRELRRAFREDTVRERSTWRGPLGLRATLDHVFVRLSIGTATSRRLPSRFGSDHYPVMTLISFD